MAGLEWIGQEEKDAVMEVMDRGGVLFRYGFEEKRDRVFKVREFEESFASAMGVEFAQAVSSGSAALRVALAALGVGPGDEVIVPCFTFVATVEAVLECGATPVVAEIDSTLNISPEDIPKRIGKKTKAILPVHMLGAAADMNRIMEIANAHNLFVIEDTAQACGSSYLGRTLGTIGHLGTFSFDYVKTMTCGEGGMVITGDEAFYQRACQYADHGHVHDPSVPRGLDPKEICGFNYRMNELQAAIGMAQLKRLDSMLERQRDNKRSLKEGLNDLRGIGFRDMLDPDGDGGDTLVLVFKNAKKASLFASRLAEERIGTKILPDALGWHFFGNWPHIAARIRKYASKDLSRLMPRSRKILGKCVALPVGLEMGGTIEPTVEALRRIAKATA